MRKIAFLVTTAVAVLALAAVAFAATQQNTYTLTQAATSPTKAGTKTKPVNISIAFDYTVGEKSGQRPAVVSKYQIRFKGLRTNGKYFKKCTAAQITQAGSNKPCPAASQVGTGGVENQLGGTADPSGKTPCNLNLRLYNGGQNKLTLYLDNFGVATPCPVPPHAFTGTYTTAAGFTTLTFSVPSDLLHPVAGVSVAVVRTHSVIARKTVTVKGRKIGYFQSIGGCIAKKRPTTVIFTQEDNTTGSASKTSACTK
jgi:hypothetical protein